MKLQLSQDIFINGVQIMAGQFIYGLAQLSQERLTIAITSIRYNNLLLPVSLAVYDLDGIEGIYIPGSITREVSKQSADQPLQSLNMLSLDPSLGAQAASSGLDIAKKIVSRKVKQAKVTITTGYQVLLKDTK